MFSRIPLSKNKSLFNKTDVFNEIIKKFIEKQKKTNQTYEKPKNRCKMKMERGGAKGNCPGRCLSGDHVTKLHQEILPLHPLRQRLLITSSKDANQNGEPRTRN